MALDPIFAACLIAVHIALKCVLVQKLTLTSAQVPSLASHMTTGLSTQPTLIPDRAKDAPKKKERLPPISSHYDLEHSTVPEPSNKAISSKSPQK
jgi:hypothetical protein